MKCPNCSAENDEFETICSKCGSYIQNRIVNINFYETIWLLIENPQKGFRKIALAEHKNYIYAIFALVGIRVTFGLKAILKIGQRYENLHNAIVSSLLDGIAYGVILLPIAAIFIHIFNKLIGGKGSLRNTMSVFAYSMLPILIMLFIVLPIEIGVWGIYFFTSNPPPVVVNPTVYWILWSMNNLLMLWTIVLLYTGFKVIHKFNIMRALISLLYTVGIVFCVLYLVAVKFNLLL